MHMFDLIPWMKVIDYNSFKDIFRFSLSVMQQFNQYLKIFFIQHSDFSKFNF